MDLPVVVHANISFVTDFLAVGGDLHPSPALGSLQLEELVELGITHVADVRLEWTDADVFAEAAPHVGYLHHGIDDAGQRVPDEWFDTGVDWALAALAEPGTRVLTHCHMGINRGPSLGFAVLLALGWEPARALTAIREARPIAAIAYAEDALRWHHTRTGATASQQARERADVARWRADNDLDVATVIRRVRGRA